MTSLETNGSGGRDQTKGKHQSGGKLQNQGKRRGKGQHQGKGQRQSEGNNYWADRVCCDWRSINVLLRHDSYVDRRGSTKNVAQKSAPKTARCGDAGSSILTCLDMPKRNAHISKAGMVPKVHCVDIELVLDRLEECGIILISIE